MRRIFLAGKIHREMTVGITVVSCCKKNIKIFLTENHNSAIIYIVAGEQQN